MSKEEEVVVIGAGLVGALLSVLLSDAGKKVRIIEKRGDLRKTVAGEGKSINLALSHRGLKALKKANLDKKVIDRAVPMYGRMIHEKGKEPHFQPYGLEGQCIYSISRLELNQLMVDEAEKRGTEISFNQKVFWANTYDQQMSTAEGKVKTDVIIGADGAFSVLRQSLQSRPLFDFSQEYLHHGYMELAITAEQASLSKLEMNALHIWPRKTFMFIALPNFDGSFTCTLFLPFKGEGSFEELNKQGGEQFFERHFPSVLSMMPDVGQQCKLHPESHLVTMKCSPWNREKNLIIGDAAHAIVPFYGQGMNAGFEDCFLLMEQLEKDDFSWETSFEEFQRLRKPDTDAIAELALMNFVEMRDKVSDPEFQFVKKIEKRLLKEFPQHWKPLYSMVTFMDIPYAEALATGKRQTAALKEVLKDQKICSEQSIQDLDLESILKEVTKKLVV